MHIRFDHPAVGWVCLCGNTYDQQGFYTCNQAGEQVDPTPEHWDGKLYVCDQCGRIIDQDFLEIVGVRANHTLSEAEIRELYDDLT